MIAWWRAVTSKLTVVNTLIDLEQTHRMKTVQPFADSMCYACTVRDKAAVMEAQIGVAIESARYRTPKQPKTQHQLQSIIEKKKPPRKDTTSLETAKKASDDVAGRRTVRKNAAGEEICKWYADGRGCDFGDNCNKKHCCDIIKKDGKVCGELHTRKEHTEP